MVFCSFVSIMRFWSGPFCDRISVTTKRSPAASYPAGCPGEGVSMLKVLIAEDEFMIADLLEETLVRSGYEVCGIARTVDEAVALAELHRPDLAVLDVRLAQGDRGTEIARRLSSRGTLGILYATGDDARHSSLTLADGSASIAKPYRVEDVASALVIVREIMTVGTATPPFPPGFRLLPEWAARSPQAPSA